MDFPMSLKRKSLVTLIPVLIGVLNIVALAEDAYFHVPIASLNFTDGSLPATTSQPARFDWRLSGAFQLWAVLDGEGEVYVSGETLNAWGPPGEIYRNANIDIRAPKGKAVVGRLFVPKPDFSGMTALSFKVETNVAKLESKDEFFKAKESHYRQLGERNIAGGAWFRHQESEAAKAHGSKAAANLNRPNLSRRRWSQSADDGYDSTYDLFSGGRAISENLQLDRVLATAGSNTATIEITNLHGITVREMDWKPLLKDSSPIKDTLASYIPFDQHALFFPSFAALTKWTDQADSDGTPVLQLFEPRSEDANSRGRYQKQLCLELNEISRLLGPQVIGSVAFTGSDPYLRTGSDGGLLFATKSPAVLEAFIAARPTGV